MLQKKQTTVAAAIPCSAMESGNHSKNRASLKSLMSRRNLLIIASILFFVVFIGACKDKDKVDEIPLSAPASVAATQVEEGIKVSWTPVGGANSYEIYITCNNIKVDGYKVYDSFTVFKPTTSGQYSFRVRAIRDDESSDWSEIVSCVYSDPNALTVPTGLTAIQVKDSIKVLWDSVKVADRYLLRVSNDEGWSNDYSYKTPGVIFYGLTHGVKYMFQVKAFRGYESSDWSDTVSCVYIDPNFLEIPTGLTAIQVKDSIKISWDSVRGAEGYLMYASNDEGWSDNYSCKTPDTLLYNLTDGAEYTFWVKAFRGDVVTNWSEPVSCVYTDSTVLTVPTGLTAIQVKDSIKVSWDSVEGADKYILSVTNDKGRSSNNYICTTPDTLFYNLTDGANYTFQVRACRKNKFTAWSDPVSCVYTDSTVLTVPTGLTVAQVGNTFKVSWDPVEGADKYIVRKCIFKLDIDGEPELDSEGNPIEIEIDDVVPDVPNAKFNNNLKNGTKYVFKVKACRGKKSTAWSIPIHRVYLAPGGGTTSGLYMGIMGFNKSINVKNISLLSNNNSNNTYSFTSFVNEMNMDNNTGLFFAIDHAVALLENSTLPEDLENVSIITFTDGIDNISRIPGGYAKIEDYRAVVKERISNTKIKGRSINAYSIGLQTGDIVGFEEQFQEDLEAMANPKENAQTTNDMNEVNNEFKKIADSLYKENQNITLKLVIPGGIADSTRVRFTFDNITDKSKVESSEYFIEGIYNVNLENYKGTLRNLKFSEGITSSCKNEKMLSGNISQGSFNGNFSFEKFEINIPLEPQNIKLWKYLPSVDSWQEETEFIPDKHVKEEIKKKSAVVVLVLDCTTSLGADGFSQMKTAATNFIRTLTKK